MFGQPAGFVCGVWDVILILTSLRAPIFLTCWLGLAEHTSSLQYLFVRLTCLDLCTLSVNTEHGYKVSMKVSNMAVRPHTQT